MMTNPLCILKYRWNPDLLEIFGMDYYIFIYVKGRWLEWEINLVIKIMTNKNIMQRENSRVDQVWAIIWLCLIISCGYIPDSYSITRCGHNMLAIRREDSKVDWAWMSFQLCLAISCGCIPDLCSVIMRYRHNMSTIRGEDSCQDPKNL